MSIYRLISIILASLLLVYLVFFVKDFNNPDLSIKKLTTLPNVAGEESVLDNSALYVKNTEDGKLFVALSENVSSEYIQKQNLQKLHSNVFWDPNRCAQMLHVVGGYNILFSDTFKKYDDTGFTSFIYKYDLQQNSLVTYEAQINIQKIFTDNVNFYAISKDKNSWTLYKINFANSKLEQIKKYNHNLDLITNSNNIKWCDSLSQNCIEDKEFNFIIQEKGNFLPQIEDQYIIGIMKMYNL